MGAARAVVFGGVVTLPALLIGVVLFLVLGGANEDWANWMWFPCYILPATIILATSIYGWKTDIPVDLE